MTRTENSVAPRAHGPRRGRWWRRLAWTAGVLVVLFVLVVFVLPTPLARFVVDRQLTSLGIAHEGNETVVVDLWNHRVAVGPMLLSAGGSAPARIGSVDLAYSLANVFQGRALIESFTISGVDIYVRRLDDGSIEINGIRPPAAAPAEPAPAEAPAAEEDAATALPFAFGMETLAFRDSRLVFEDLTGGTLTLDLALFSLEDFLSWEPEAPETIVLEGTLNGMAFAFDGTSTLFADPITLDIEGGFTDATLDRVAEFTGPTGLEHQAGTLDTHGRHRYTLEDGAIRGTSEGTVVIAGVDVATPEGDAVTTARAEITYDVEPAVAADRTVTIGGAFDVALTELALTTAAGDAVSIAGGRLDLADLAVTKAAELRLPDGADMPDGGAARGGSGQGLLQLLVQQLIALGQEVLRYNLEGSLSPTLALDDVALRAGGQAVRLGDLTLEAPGLTARGVADTWSLETPLSLRVADIAVEGPQTAALGSLDLEVEALAAETDLENARIGFDLRLDAADARGAVPADGIEASLTTLALSTAAAEVSGWPGRGRAAGAFDVRAGGLAATVPAGDGPAQVEVEEIDIALSPLTVEDTGALAVTAAGRIDAGGIGAAMAGPSPLEARLASVAVELAEAALGPSSQRVAADVTLGELTAEMASEPPQKLAVARTDISGLEADMAAAIAVERITLGGLDAEIAVAAMGGGGAAPPGPGGNDAGDGATRGGDARGPAADGLPPLRLGSIVVEAGSQLRIVDQSAGEAVRLRFDIQGLEVGPIDTTAPATRTAFDADLSVEDTATVTADGSATPLAPAPDGDLTLRIDGFPLPLVSPYAGKLGGVTIESGELSLDVDGAASGGALEGVVGLTVADLFLGEPSEEAAARFEEDFGVPIGFAVGILKDGNGVIDFDLPVSGTVAEPSIDYGQVVSKAIGGALASVFPTSWIGGDGAANVDIEPVPFEPGAAELTEAGSEVADRIGEILNQKATLRVRVCGKGARADLAALRGVDPEASEPLSEASPEEVNQVLELALERGRAVRAHLVERHGIAADRIGDCRTSYSFEGDAPPRAEFQL